MKRMLLAAGLAIGIHALLLSVEPDWRHGLHAHKPAAETVTLLLVPAMPTVLETHAISRPPDLQMLKPKRQMPEAPTSPTLPAEQRNPESRPTRQRIPQKAPVREPTAPSPPPKEAFVPPLPVDRSTRAFRVPDTFPQKTDSSPPPVRPSSPSRDLSSGASDRTDSTGRAALQVAIPEYRRNPPIAYPSRARRRGYEGTVILEVLVNQSGRVDDLRVLTSSGYPSLDRTAVASVRSWSFTPARRGDETVAMWVQVPVLFKLE